MIEDGATALAGAITNDPWVVTRSDN